MPTVMNRRSSQVEIVVDSGLNPLSSMRFLLAAIFSLSFLFTLTGHASPIWPPSPTACDSDLNSDGVVCLSDLLVLLSHFGGHCDPVPPEPADWGRIHFSEFHYNPASVQGPDSEFEFLELFNADSVTIDLSGWSLSEGLSMNFPDGAMILAGQYVVVTTAPTTYAGFDYPVYDWGSGGLNNSGEWIALRAPDGSVVESVAFSDTGEWDTAPDGQGPSLERLFLEGDPQAPSTWSASISVGGTPGATNSLWLD